MVQIAEQKPPYVTFETRAIEDREASMANGYWVGKDVLYAIITPAGSKDKIEKQADEWLRDLQEQVRNDRFPGNWYDHYKKIFSEFKEGQEIPEDGTPILTWPVLSPAQRQTLLSVNIRTVEQLAEANESALAAVGMGARNLKEQAINWFKAASDMGGVTKKVTSLEQENKVLQEQVTELLGRLQKLETVQEKEKEKV